MKNRRPRQWLVDAGAIFVALVFIVPVWWALNEEQRLLRDGQITRGVVLSKETIDGGGETSTELFVRYSFQDASDRQRTGSMSVEDRLYQRVSPGDPLPIQYLTDDPGRSRIAGEFSPAVLLGVALAALGLCYFFILGPQRWLRELRGGRDPVLP
jgi:hypothetical protein